MSTMSVMVRGTLKPDGTLELDEKIPLAPGRMQVIVQPVPTATQKPNDVWTVLETIAREQTGVGRQPRSREEIDEEINSLRNEWVSPPRALD